MNFNPVFYFVKLDGNIKQMFFLLPDPACDAPPRSGVEPAVCLTEGRWFDSPVEVSLGKILNPKRLELYSLIQPKLLLMCRLTPPSVYKCVNYSKSAKCPENVNVFMDIWALI